MDKQFYSENRRRLAAYMTGNDAILFSDVGIYVHEWGIGLRIEDNVLVTADGCENLSAAILATIEEIESLMAHQHE